jgi:hypothetical protein
LLDYGRLRAERKGRKDWAGGVGLRGEGEAQGGLGLGFLLNKSFSLWFQNWFYKSFFK